MEAGDSTFRHEDGVEFRIHPAIRVRPSLNNGDSWQLSNLYSKESWNVSPPVVAFVLGFSSPKTAEDAEQLFAEAAGVEGSVRPILESLRAKRILIAADDSSVAWIDAMGDQWRKYSWREAFDYHLASMDYPFLDYSDGGWSVDAQLMGDYLDQEPDVERYNEDARASAFPLPTCVESLAGFGADFRAIVSHEPQAAVPLEATSIGALMAGAFGALAWRGRELANDRLAMRRTSPSGGSRHPSEGYVYVVDVPGLEPGFWHYGVGSNALHRCGDAVPADRLEELFPGPMRAEFPIAAFVIITTVFERNMYRYREPRTFRTVFLDASHLAYTVELLAESNGWEAYGQAALLDDEIERRLGIESRFAEGVNYCVALGAK